MQIAYLASAKPGLKWFRRYYTRIFPEGEKTAVEQFNRMQRVLASAPMIGKPFEDSGSREYVIPRIPFTVIYRISGETIEVQLLLDQRAERADRS